MASFDSNFDNAYTETFIPDGQPIMGPKQLIDLYFITLQLTRLEEKGGYVIYGAKVQDMDSTTTKYLLAIILKQHDERLSIARTQDLPWVNLQYQPLQNSTYLLAPQPFRINYNLDDVPLQILGRTEFYTDYTAEPQLPYKIQLKHNPKKKSRYQYQDTMSLHRAFFKGFGIIITYEGTI
jgi:hypothetical protein